MIIALMIWLFKKYCRPFLKRNTISGLSFQLIKRSAIILILLLTRNEVTAQEKTLNYNVLHNGTTVGRMQLQQRKDGENTFLKITSEVKMRFIISVQVNIADESYFCNGKLICSHVQRVVNGKTKANKYTKAFNNSYQLIDHDKIGSLDQKQIGYNLDMVYLREPVGLSLVYSDNFQQYVPIKQTADHTYRIDLPDGNYNFYSYSNGICSKVELHHSFYKIQLQLA